MEQTPTFQPGQLVRLKSGSTLLTVELPANELGNIQCVYQDDSDRIRRVLLPAEVLMPAESKNASSEDDQTFNPSDL